MQEWCGGGVKSVIDRMRSKLALLIMSVIYVNTFNHPDYFSIQLNLIVAVIIILKYINYTPLSIVYHTSNDRQ